MKRYLICLNGLPVNSVDTASAEGFDPSVDQEKELEFAVINPKVSLELGSAGNLEFTLPPGHPIYEGYSSDSGQNNETSEQRRWTSATVTLQEEGDYIFAGRVYSWQIDMFKRKKICCEGALMFLHDSVQPYAVYDGISIKSFVETVITYHNMQVNDNRKIYVGNLSNLFGPAVYRVTSWESTFDTLQKFVIDTNGGYFHVRTISTSYGKYKHFLDYYSQHSIQLDKDDNVGPGAITASMTLANDQVIEFGENLLDISESFSMDDVATQVLPLGATILSDQILKELGFIDDEENAVIKYTTTCRKDAGEDYQPVNNYAWLYEGRKVTVDNMKRDINNNIWYHIKFKVKLYGYVWAGHTDKEDEYEADGEGTYGSAQVTADWTPVRLAPCETLSTLSDYDPDDAVDESQFVRGQTFTVKGCYVDLNGGSGKWFAVEFPEKNPSGYVPQSCVEPITGYSQGAPIIRAMSIVPIGWGTFKAKSGRIRTGPGKEYKAVANSPKLTYGDMFEVCDVDYEADETNVAWYYVKKNSLYGYVIASKCTVPDNVKKSLPNDMSHKPGGPDKYAIMGANHAGVPGFYTDQWAQSLSLTTDNRRTIAAWNKGRIVLTIEDALAFEEYYGGEMNMLLDGVTFTAPDKSKPICEPMDLGGLPIDNASLKKIKKIEKAQESDKDMYYLATDNDCEKRFGLITKVIEYSDCKTAEELMKKASRYLLEKARYPVQITVSSADLHYFNLNWESFKIGQFVTVKFPGWKSDFASGVSPYYTELGRLLRILKIEIDLATGRKSINIGTQKRKDLTEITKEIKDEAERDKNKIKVMSEEDYSSLSFVEDDKIYFCAGD